MSRTLPKFLLAAALLALFASPASAFWTFQFHNLGSTKICSGEANDPNYASICNFVAPWGDDITTNVFDGDCYATICCANGSSTGLCYSCPATEQAGILPGICGAFTQSGSNYNSNYVWCKSNAYGQWKGDCQGGWR